MRLVSALMRFSAPAPATLLGALATVLFLTPRPVPASPLEFVSPRDPLAAELRVLECYELPADSGRFRLPHFNTWPQQRQALMGDGAPIGQGDLVRRLVADRIERELQRDAGVAFADARTRRSTPRLWQRTWPGDERAELSVGLEGGYDASRSDAVTDTRWRDGSGVHFRAAVQSERLLFFTHFSLGQLAGASRYTDVLLSDTDLALQTEESYAAYTVHPHWSIAIGRQRFAWGPGEEGSLLLSRTSAPLTALWLHGRLQGLRADFTAIHATTEPGRGEQLAAHRIEWQPAGNVRLGVSEAARYQSDGWQAVYLASVIPFSLAQRLLAEDGDSTGTRRNNIELGFDASWRVADGTRVYAEVLLDDLHAKTATVPNKYAFQTGLDGAWTHGFTRLTWNAEYTFLSRYVYTSFFGRSYVAQGAPLGFPTGPDARRLRLRMSWDPRVDWQVTGIAARTWKGENDLDEPFVQGSPVPSVSTLEGVASTSDDFTGIVRWWPASGVDLSLALGWQRTDDAGHVAGITRRGTHASLGVRLSR